MTDEKEYRIEEAEENADNKEFMLNAIKNGSPWVIKYASDKLCADKELMLAAVNVDGQELYYASQELRDDKDIAIEALKQNLNAKEYLTEKALKYDEVKDILSPKENEE